MEQASCHDRWLSCEAWWQESMSKNMTISGTSEPLELWGRTQMGIGAPKSLGIAAVPRKCPLFDKHLIGFNTSKVNL